MPELENTEVRGNFPGLQEGKKIRILKVKLETVGKGHLWLGVDKRQLRRGVQGTQKVLLRTESAPAGWGSTPEQ
jgi:hypothetical protein